MRRLVVLAVLVMSGLLWCMAPAVADDGSLLIDVPGDSVGFTHDPVAPLVHAQRLAPGSSHTSDFALRNTSASPARLVLTVTDVVDEENGCLPQEAREAGEQCDADGGELSGWMTATISRDDRTGATLWSGDFRDLTRGVQLTDDLPAGATWPLRITVAMLATATNDTMTDTVSFGTRFEAESDAGDSAVTGAVATVGGTGPHGSGAQAGATPGSAMLGPLAHGPRVGLPMTGGTISLWMLVLDAGLLLSGALLVWRSRRRPAPRHARSRARRTRRRASASPTPSVRISSANS